MSIAQLKELARNFDPSETLDMAIEKALSATKKYNQATHVANGLMVASAAAVVVTVAGIVPGIVGLATAAAIMATRMWVVSKLDKYEMLFSAIKLMTGTVSYLPEMSGGGSSFYGVVRLPIKISGDMVEAFHAKANKVPRS